MYSVPLHRVVIRLEIKLVFAWSEVHVGGYMYGKQHSL